MNKMKRKKFLIFLIMAVSLGIILYLIPDNKSNVQDAKPKEKHARTIDQEYDLNISDLSFLNINSTNTDIKIIITEQEDIKAHFYGTFLSEDANYYPSLKVDKTGESGSISIEYPTSFFSGPISNQLKLDVYIPETYHQQLVVQASSANVSFDELKLSHFKCTTTSGNITGVNISAEKIEIYTSSGDINSSINSAGYVQLQSISGDHNLPTVKGQTVSLNTSSGNVNCQNVECNDFLYQSISGKLNIKHLKCNNSSIESSSGNIQVAGPSTEKVNLKTISGVIFWDKLTTKETTVSTSSGKTELLGDPGVLNINSNSGNVILNINRLEQDVTIYTSSGKIELILPTHSQFGLEFLSSSGKLNLEGFSLDFEKNTVKNNEIQGFVGKDSPKIKIQSISGNAVIKTP